MKIYNQDKTLVLENPDLEKGYLVKDKIVLKVVPAKPEVAKQSHYEVIKEYPNGGKEVKEVIDVPYSPAVKEHEETEEIQVYIPYSAAEYEDIVNQKLRAWREKYFTVIDRAVWYDTLSLDEKLVVKQFRKQLLDITITKQYPVVPAVVEAQIK